MAASLCLLPMQGRAQEVSSPTPKLLTRAHPSSYVLGPGDQLTIRVVDLEEYSDKNVRVGPDGDLDLPLIGPVQAAGATIESFKQDLATRLSKYIDSPKVSISLMASQSGKISVVGEVNAPGVRDLSGPTTLIEAISGSGGVKTDAGSTVIVTRSIKNGTLPIDGSKLDDSGQFSTVSLSLDGLLSLKNPSDNFTLRPGDIVSIPKASIIYVVGDVHRPGGFPLPARSTMSVIKAIALAEGLTSNNASRSARILRPNPTGEGKPTEIPVNVQAILAGKANDPSLLAEDILYIPHSTAEAGAKRAAEIALQVATGVLIYR
ncbi:MAG: polysaccharide export protein [Edaphobacter sp.]|uniref:polysaccharide biosynthesis/export family protein n=1 Tax=Edaphobacter sp. TaxID=1934404 RepID=UPI00239D81ED|nr:polysaccharide biosynthesis/export family protein [Edaphobacter sp.]MDE1175568.1 polysaccharide export protein [Edaphobacter sp.]